MAMEKVSDKLLRAFLMNHLPLRPLLMARRFKGAMKKLSDKLRTLLQQLLRLLLMEKFLDKLWTLLALLQRPILMARGLKKTKKFLDKLETLLHLLPSHLPLRPILS
jgi:hypothetical protein